ncbi:hypothetical protein [Veillonella seminalis]|uniref:hypothetical protein n=1 Tax=Veillonella seminalis TaxID=1502943 RepID=UPI003DA2AA27
MATEKLSEVVPNSPKLIIKTDDTVLNIVIKEGLKGDKGDRGHGITRVEQDGYDIHLYFEDGTSYTVENVRGEKGEKGDIGLTGPQGEQGIEGPRGEQGIKGDQGIQGPQGIQGEQGPVGPQGIQGPKGDKGDRGSEGPRGLQGERGPKGDTGDTGMQGLIGVVVSATDPQTGQIWIEPDGDENLTYSRNEIDRLIQSKFNEMINAGEVNY